MTEKGWLACTDLTQMLIHLRGEVEPPEKEPDPRPRLITRHGPLVFGDGKRVSEQRLRRFASQVCRKWQDLPLDDKSRKLVLGYERFLLGIGSWEDFTRACSYVWNAATGARPLINTMCQWFLTPYGMANLAQDLAWVTACYRHREQIEELERTASEDDRFAWGFFGYDFPEFGETAMQIQGPLPKLLREIVGNPFRPLAVNRSWLTPVVVRLAEAIDMDQVFEDGLPVLAYALEEAGCADADILGHCRQPGPHVRGCWVVDLLLGKE